MKSFVWKYLPVIVLLPFLFLVLSFTSECSFFFEMNEWVDVNCYFTVAKVMNSGGVLYRDIYEQKGIYLYWIHQLAVLGGGGTYHLMFLFEYLLGLVFIYFTYRILSLYFSNEIKKTIATMIIVVAYYITFSFVMGDSSEEMIIPLYVIAMYFALRHIKLKEAMRLYKPLLIGLFLGIALFVKFTLVSFFVAFFLLVFIFYLIDKNYKGSILFLLTGIGGFILSIIPVLLYFGLNHAFSDLWNVYFYNNMFLYSSANDHNFFNSVLMFFTSYFKAYGYGYAYYILIIIGFIYMIVAHNYKGNRVTKFILFSYIITNIIIFIGGRSYMYYGLVNIIFSFTGILGIAYFIPKIKKVNKLITNHFNVVSIGSGLFLLIVAFVATPNSYEMYKSRDQYVQYQFKDIINSEENVTLLNYGRLDMGLYYLTGINPTTKYFCGLNIPLKAIIDEHNRIVENGEVTYVVAYAEEVPNIYNKYKLVAQKDYTVYFDTYTYYLYRLK